MVGSYTSFTVEQTFLYNNFYKFNRFGIVSSQSFRASALVRQVARVFERREVVEYEDLNFWFSKLETWLLIDSFGQKVIRFDTAVLEALNEFHRSLPLFGRPLVLAKLSVVRQAFHANERQRWSWEKRRRKKISARPIDKLDRHGLPVTRVPISSVYKRGKVKAGVRTMGCAVLKRLPRVGRIISQSSKLVVRREMRNHSLPNCV